MISNRTHSPEYVNVVDDSDDEIIYLGNFAPSSESSNNTQATKFKEEITDINPGVLDSNFQGTRKSQQIILHRGEAEDGSKKPCVANLNVNSPLLIKKSSREESLCSISNPKSQSKNLNSTSSSIAASGINRAKKISNTNSRAQPSVENTKHYYTNAIGKTSNEIFEDSLEEKTNISSSVPCASSSKEPIKMAKLSSTSHLISGTSHSNICLPERKVITSSQIISNPRSPQENSCRSETVNSKLLIQNSTSSSDIPFTNPMLSNGVTEMKSVHHSTTSMQNISAVAQPKLGSQLKQQIRYVPLPAKFFTEKTPRQTVGNTLSGSSIIQIVNGNIIKQPANQNILKSVLQCDGDKVQRSMGPKTQNVPDINNPSKATTAQSVQIVGNPVKASPKIVFVKNVPSAVPKINSVKEQNNAGPPSMLLLNNQIFKLKGIKKPESLLKKPSIISSDTQKKDEPHVPVKCVKCGAGQCCQMNNSMKTFVDQSCQTNLYSWIYKNSKLYTFIDDGGKQVEVVPVNTVRVENRPIETDVASPVSSLDQSDFSEDEISVTDEPAISHKPLFTHPSTVNACPSTVNARLSSENACPSTVNAALQTDCVKPYANTNGMEPNSSKKLRQIYQPENTFQEVTYTTLGLYNPALRPADSVQTGLLNNQISYENNTYHQEDVNTNTVYNHELQMYVPASQQSKPEPLFQQPAFVNPNNQCFIPNNNINNNNNNNNAVVDIFNKLIVDINTCLTSDALGNIPLHQAVLKNDLAKLKSQCVVLKTIGSNLNHINLTHETALMLAVKVAVGTQDYEAVSILVSEGADPRIADLDGNTPLHYAVRHGSSQLVKVLLTAEDADKVTEKFNYDGFTPLHIAAKEGLDDIIKLLVGTTIDINIKDRKNGRTPYFLAVKENKLASAQLLKMFGADINVPNFADQMPYFFASPEKTLSQQPQDADDPGLLDDSHLEILEKEKIPDVSLLSQVLDISEPSFVYVGRNETGLRLPPNDALDRNDQGKDKEIAEKTSKSFDSKELFKKYVKIAEKRKLESQREESLKKKVTKKLKIPPVALNETTDGHLQNINTAYSSSQEQNQSSNSGRNKSDYQSQPLCPEKNIVEESYTQNVEDKLNCSTNNAQEVHIRNDSVSSNKAVLSSSNHHGDHSCLVMRNISEKDFKDHLESCESSSKVNTDKHPSHLKLSFTNPINENESFVNQNENFICYSATDNLPENGQNILSYPLSASENIYKKLAGNPKLSTKVQKDSPPFLIVIKSKSEDCNTAKTDQPMDLISHSSLDDNKNTNDQNTPSNSIPVETVGDTSDILLLPNTRQEKSPPSLGIEKSCNSKSRSSVKRKNPEHNLTKNNRNHSLIRGSEVTSEKGSSEVLKKIKTDSLSKEGIKPNSDKTPFEVKKISDLNTSTLNEVCTNTPSVPLCSVTSEESASTMLITSQQKKVQDELCKITDKLNKDKIPPKNFNFQTQLLSVPSEKASNEILKKRKTDSLSTKEEIKPNSDKTTLEVKQINDLNTSTLNEVCTNTPSVPLCSVTSEESASTMLITSQQKKVQDELCKITDKLNKDKIPPKNFNFQTQLPSVSSEKVSNEILKKRKTDSLSTKEEIKPNSDKTTLEVKQINDLNTSTLNEVCTNTTSIPLCSVTSEESVSTMLIKSKQNKVQDKPCEITSKLNEDKQINDLNTSTLNEVCTNTTSIPLCSVTSEESVSTMLIKSQQKKVQDEPCEITSKLNEDKQINDLNTSTLNEVCTNTPSIPLCSVTSEESVSTMLIKSQQKKVQDELCKITGKLNKDKIPPKNFNFQTQLPPVTSEKGSNKILKKRKTDSLSTKEEIKPNSDKTTLEVKQINDLNTSTLNEVCTNTPSIPLCSVTSEESASTMLIKSQQNKIQDEPCKITSKCNKDQIPPKNLNFDTQLPANKTDYKNIENEKNCDSDNEIGCFECCFNLNFENEKDIIIGNGSPKPNNDNPIRNSSNCLPESETELLKFSYNTILDDVAIKDKEVNLPSQKTDRKPNNHQKKKPFVNTKESVRNFKCIDPQRTKTLKITQNTDSPDTTATNRVNSLTSLSLKEVSDANLVGSTKDLNKNPENITESRGLSVSTVLNSNPEKVSILKDKEVNLPSQKTDHKPPNNHKKRKLVDNAPDHIAGQSASNSKCPVHPRTNDSEINQNTVVVNKDIKLNLSSHKTDCKPNNHRKKKPFDNTKESVRNSKCIDPQRTKTLKITQNTDSPDTTATDRVYSLTSLSLKEVSDANLVGSTKDLNKNTENITESRGLSVSPVLNSNPEKVSIIKDTKKKKNKALKATGTENQKSKRPVINNYDPNKKPVPNSPKTLKLTQNTDSPDTTATDRVNSLTSLTLNEVSDANLVGSTKDLNKNPENITESRGLSVSPVLNSNPEKVSIIKNTKKKKNKALKSTETENQKSKRPVVNYYDPNKKPVPNSPKVLVTNMRNKLVSLVSCKVSLPTTLSSTNASEDSILPVSCNASLPTTLSSTNASGDSVLPCTSTKSIVLKILELKQKGKSIESILSDIKSNATEQIDGPTTSSLPKLPVSPFKNNKTKTTEKRKNLKELDTENKRVSISSVPKLPVSPSKKNKTNTIKKRKNLKELDTENKGDSISSVPKLTGSQSQENSIASKEKNQDLLELETQEPGKKKIISSLPIPKLTVIQSQENRTSSRKKSWTRVEQEESGRKKNLVFSPPMSSGSQSQENRTKSRKKSLESVESETQETGSLNSKVMIREKNQVPNVLSRNSSRMSKK